MPIIIQLLISWYLTVFVSLLFVFLGVVAHCISSAKSTNWLQNVGPYKLLTQFKAHYTSYEVYHTYFSINTLTSNHF